MSSTRWLISDPIAANDLQLAAPSVTMSQTASSPSTSSVFSSSLDDSSLTEQGSELSGSGSGKPSGRLKRRISSQPSSRGGKKRIRTSCSTLAHPAGRKRSKGKTLPLSIPSGFFIANQDFQSVPLINGESGVILPFSEGDEDSSHASTVVVFRATDEFLRLQDICASCGSIGVNEEGKLIGCAQCGQCYHSYCAGVKLSSAVLTSGWRCLDCTLCEVCGKPHDEGRLILCDECDISFHIYCLDPPLDQVPQGTWKCRRCVRCQYCDSASPGHGSAQWHDNFSTCTPCASLQKCPVCEKGYVDQELVIQCLQCDRWLHASCDAIMDDDDVESALSIGYVCPYCRPENHPPLHLQHVFADEDSNDYNSDVAEPKPAVTHKYEGMLLSEFGLKHVKRLSLEHAKPKVSKRKQSKLADQPAFFRSESSQDTVLTLSQDSSDRADETSVDGKKKRARRPQRFGIGGFLLRGPKPKAEKDKDGLDTGDNSMEGHVLSGTLSPTESLDTHLAEVAGLDPSKYLGNAKSKKKKPQPKKKFTVKDSFPDYLQDAFFGRTLLDGKENDNQGSTPEPLSLLVNIDRPEPAKPAAKVLTGDRSSHNDKKQISTEILVADSGKVNVNKVHCSQTESHSADEEEDFPDFADPGFDAFLTQDLPDDDLLGMLMAATEHEEEPPVQEDDPMQGTPVRLAKNSEHDPITDNLDSILDSLESDLPQMSCEDAEDVFNDVFLAEESSSTSALTPRTMSSESGAVTAAISVSGGRLISVLPNGVETISNTTSWVTQSATAVLGTTGSESAEGPNNNAKTVLKWEQDESLGAAATISAVLFANIQQPELKQKFPEFLERYKQIAKLWRKVSTEERQPFLQKARENRAASRANKAQKAKEEKCDKAATAAAAAVKGQECPPTGFGAPGYIAAQRFPQLEAMESPYYTGQEEIIFPNPATPLSQPSTPGSAASHPHHPQYHVGSPAPPFSPPLDRPRSVLAPQHHGSEQMNYSVQSPHPYQQVQSPRTPYPPNSPFDPYAPPSVQPALSRQQSIEYPSLAEEHDPYAQPPGTPMPQQQQSFPQQYPHPSNPQSPQNGQYLPRQQLRDLLARQNQSRQRQQLSPNTWQYPQQQQSPNGTFSPLQGQDQFGPRMASQNFQRQEFRPPPPPPQSRIIQQGPRNFQSPQQRFSMPVRVPNHTLIQRVSQPNSQFSEPQMYDQTSQMRSPQQQWQQQQQMIDQQQHYGPQYPETTVYSSMDPQQHQHIIRAEYGEHRFPSYRPPVSQSPYGPRSPSVISLSPNQSRPPMQWSSQSQQQFSSIPPRAQSVAPPPVHSPPVQMQQVMMNGMSEQRTSDDQGPLLMTEAERQNNMNQESFLLEHFHRLNSEQLSLEGEIAKVRKQRKAMAARQRQLKKNAGDLTIDELTELDRLTQSVSTIQKQLEQVRKQNKAHQNTMQEFTAKTGIQLVPPQVVSGARMPHQMPAGSLPVNQQIPSGVIMHQVRSNISPYHPAVGPPGQPGPYPPQNIVMSPKREDMYVPVQQTMAPYGDQYYQDPHVSSGPRPQQQPRFAVPQLQSGATPLPYLTSSPQNIQGQTNQSFPPEPKIQQQMQTAQTSSGFQASLVNHPGEVRSPQPPTSLPLLKMDALPSNLSSTKTVGLGFERAELSDTDGRSIFSIKRSVDPHTSSKHQNAADSLGERPNEKKNILLKQLLEQGNSIPPSLLSPERRASVVSLTKSTTEDEDDSLSSTLTPAQQQQLAMIESMPLTLRKESLVPQSPLLSTVSGNETLNPPVSEASVDGEGGKKKKSAKKKKKKGCEENGDGLAADPPAESIVNILVEQLRQCHTVTLFEPDKNALPPKSIFIKSETDAAPVPVGKKLEDLRKPARKSLLGSFGQYEVARNGPKSRFYVGVNGSIEDILPWPIYSSRCLFEECIEARNVEIPLMMKTEAEIKPEMGDYSPLSPALSYVSTSSYGESRLLEPCYDYMFNWLDICYPPDGPPSCEMVIYEPTLLPTSDPGTPNSVKENFTENPRSDITPATKSTKFLKESDRVNVSLTVTEEAARDINTFLHGLATLLQIPVSEIVMSECDDYDSAVVPVIKEDKIQKFCRTCEIALSPGNGIRRALSDFPLVSVVDKGFPVEMEGGTAYVSFCGNACLMQFAINNQSGLKTSPPATVSVDHGVDGTPKIEPKKEKRDNSPSKRLTSVQVILKSIAPLLKRGKKTRYELWSPGLLQVKKPPPAVEPLTAEQILSLLDVGIKLKCDQVRDVRVCVFCHLIGDFLTDGPGRLLNIDGDHWVHLNCALWSSQVYETLNGHLMNVDVACQRGARTECSRCKKLGATLACYNPKIRCNQVFHFPCAKIGGCMFFKDKSVLCDLHKPREHPEEELRALSVHRRVYVHRDEPRLVARIIQSHDTTFTFRYGTLIFHSIGQLFHQNMDAFHNENCLYPVGFSVTRIFWSMRSLHKRCYYQCTIHEVHGNPEFRISVREPGFEDVLLIDVTSKGVWMKVLTAVLQHRPATMIKVFPDFFSGDDLFGLTEANIIKAIESLPGAADASHYLPKSRKPASSDAPVTLQPVASTGCTRAQPKLKIITKRKYMFRMVKNEVCDAARAGGPARFINHSCDPNCTTEIIPTDKDDKKMIISTVRKIQQGEELCYDYKFDLEGDEHKIPCNCISRSCKHWMN